MLKDSSIINYCFELDYETYIDITQDTNPKMLYTEIGNFPENFKIPSTTGMVPNNIVNLMFFCLNKITNIKM